MRRWNETKRFPRYQWPLSIALSVLYCLYAASAQAQLKANLAFQKIEIPSGATEGFTSAAQDSMGFLWFGSYNGLWKYNGRDFEKITYLPGVANSLAPSRPEMVLSGNKNDLWIGTTRGGISRFEHRSGKFSSWQHNPEDAQSIGGNEIGGMAIDTDGILWAGSNPYCLNRIDPETRKVRSFYPPLPEIPSGEYSGYLGGISTDPINPNLLWIGSPFGIYVFDKTAEQFKLHQFPRFISKVFKSVPVNLFIDQKGDVWTTNGKGPVKWLRDSQRWETEIIKGIGKKDLLGALGNPVYTRLTDEEILIQPRSEGLYLYNVFNGNTQFLNEQNVAEGPVGNIPFRFAIKDKQGDLWFGSGTELYRAYPPEWQWKYLAFPNRKLRNWTAAILPDPAGNAVFIGTKSGEGLMHYDLDNGLIKSYRYRFDGFRGSDVSMEDLALDNAGNIWIATPVGLLTLAHNSDEIKKIGSWKTSPGQSDGVKSIIIDNGILWVGTETLGLYAIFLPDQAPTAWALKNAGLLKDMQINDMLAVGENQLFLGTNYGLSLYDFKQNSFFGGKRLTISGVDVTHLEYAKDSSIWMSTYGHGLYHIDPAHPNDYERFITNIISNGNDIYHFSFAENGDIWIHTDGGMVSFNPATARFQHHPEFGVGLRGPTHRMSTGHLVTGTAKGLRYFHPDDVENLSTPPIPYISSIDIANRNEYFPLAPNYISQVTLQPDERELSIRFDGINFNRRSGKEFSYRLLGYQDEWQAVSGERVLNFNNLAPGEYSLEIKAINEYGKSSLEARKLLITVLPPFYKTAWFLGGLLALIGMLAVLIYRQVHRRKMQRLQALQQERALLNIQKEIAESKLTALQAQMNPHFIFNSLNSINWYILKNRPQEASQYLTKFSRLVRLILDNSKNLSIALNKELESLKLYLDLEAMRFENKFDYTIRIDADIEMEEVLIPPLILQPFVENAIWHGLMHKKTKGELLVQIYPENQYLKCIVEDNGIGRKAAKAMQSKNQHQHQSKGMKLTNDRLQLLHRDFLKEDRIRVIDLEDENGVPVGTRVEVTLPYD